ncbi:MAG: hypothetical protein KJ955_02865 [Nanoarchaeota archaeon]|nr:hypothetical protein [Nanoarchaeota archaeon]
MLRAPVNPEKRRSALKKEVIMFSIVLLSMLAFLNLIDSYNSQPLITGYAVLDVPAETEEAMGVMQEQTQEGLALSYEALEQGEIVIGQPVKWEQRIEVHNPLENIIADPIFQLELPLDASNINIFFNGDKISDDMVVLIPSIEAGETLELMLSFETSPVMVEIIEEFSESDSLFGKLFNQPVKKIRIWHDSSLKYTNIPVEIDSHLGERLIGEYEGVQEMVDTDYSDGKSRWVIARL